MIEVVALSIIAIAGIYFVVLGIASLIVPDKAASFLLGFAGSARLHYIELFVRIAVGAAFVTSAHYLVVSQVFAALGWVLLVTSVLLLLVPWQWHHHFASQVVPAAVRYIALIGSVSMTIGGFILAALAYGLSI